MDRRQQGRGDRRDRLLQTIAFVGALVVLVMVLYPAFVLQRQRERELENWRLTTAVVPTAPAPPVPTAQVGERVLPTPCFGATLLQAPLAWTRTRGAGVTVAVTQGLENDLPAFNLVAPEAELVELAVSRLMLVEEEPLLELLARQGIAILAIADPGDFESQTLRDVVFELTRSGIAVFVSADVSGGPPGMSEVINDLEALGAITVGRLESDGRPGWALLDGEERADFGERRMNLFAPSTRYYQGSPVSPAVLNAAASGALVLSLWPNLGPEGLKYRLVETADPMYSQQDPETGETWRQGGYTVDPVTGRCRPASRAFRFLRLNAARAVGVELAQPWPLNAIAAPDAWKTATGSGVTVALLDLGFHLPAFGDELVDTQVFSRAAYQEVSSPNHGTLMAQAVLAVAPDARLAFLASSDVESYARALDYAVETGVQVVAITAPAQESAEVANVAVDRAIEAGLVVVWPGYTGPNRTVIRPGVFWDPHWEVGAFDQAFDLDCPSELEGDWALTVSQVAAVAALLLESEPGLTPLQVKQRILETAVPLGHGASLVDAAAAVENRPSGRVMLDEPIPGGRCLVVYREAGSEEEIAVEIEEAGLNWPVPIWPRRDILLYGLDIDRSGEGISYRYGVYREGKIWLMGYLTKNRLVSGPSAALVSLFVGPEDPPVELVAFLGMGEIDERIPLLQVELEDSWVSLSWQDENGVPLYDYAQEIRDEMGSDSGYTLLRFELEAPLLPEVWYTWY